MSNKEHKAGKKRPKSYYRKSGKNYSKPDRKLQSGMQGILMTCSGNAAQCVREAYSLLNEYADKIYGPEELVGKDCQVNEEEEESGSDEDISVSLQKEVQAMKEQRSSRDRRFRNVHTGAKNVIFIQTKGVDPHKIVCAILTDLEATGVQKGRYVQRMLPVSHTCRALEERIEKASQEMLYPAFHAPGAPDATFCILFKARNNGEVKKDAIVKLLAPMVLHGSTHIHKVDFGAPDRTVMVDVIGAVCCLSVLEGYERFKRYNLHLVAKGNRDAGNRGVKRKGENASQEAEQGRVGEELDPAGDAKRPRQEDSSVTATTLHDAADCIAAPEAAAASPVATTVLDDPDFAAISDQAGTVLDTCKENDVSATDDTLTTQGALDGVPTPQVATGIPESSNSSATPDTTATTISITSTTPGKEEITAPANSPKETTDS